MAKDTLSALSKKIESREAPRELLRDIFKFINLKPAKIDIYFSLLDSETPLTVNEICRSLDYSERTIRKYLQKLLKIGYITRDSTIRNRPCYVYSAIRPKEVWKKLVDEVRAIRIKASKSISRLK